MPGFCLAIWRKRKSLKGRISQILILLGVKSQLKSFLIFRGLKLDLNSVLVLKSTLKGPEKIYIILQMKI